jgi:signal transduction histidine kinase
MTIATPLSGIPIRLRLTLVFALAMAAVLAATGLFLYTRLETALGDSVDRSLRSRAADVAPLAKQTDRRQAEPDGLTRRGESIAQVLTAGGAVVDSTPDVGPGSLLSAEERSEAAAGQIEVSRDALPGSDDPVRLLATPVETPAGARLVVVGASLEPKAEALESLLTELLVGGPLVLALASLAAYALAAAALRPVESMRREAEAVSAAEPGRRLPLPPARDEVARLGATLNEMLARLEAALARERRFVSDASHELRTPLAALRAELELALRRQRTPAELEAALRSAADETDRLSQLAEDLLVLARSEAGVLPVRRAPLRVVELLTAVQERYATRARGSGRAIEVDAPGDLELAADRLRLEQALGNLVENAFRHGRGRILLAARACDGAVELHVLDEGGGFTEGFVEQAFEPFAREDRARSSPGAGLGLAIVDVIARAHGGAAHAANANGGADVWLALPA